MVKRQNEKQYQSAREHRANSQLRAGGGGNSSSGTVQRTLPFHCCALTLVPYEHPVVCGVDKYGIVFENSALMPFLLKHKTNPVTGDPTTTRDVITLNMDKDEEGRWQCPVLTKPFSDHSKIVAIVQRNTQQQDDGKKKSSSLEANVYSYEAYHELNVKAKNYQDLISGQKFDKNKDVIVLNDPSNETLNQKRDIENFHHIQQSRHRTKQTELVGSSTSTSTPSSGGNVRHSVTSTRILDAIQKEKRKRKDREAAAAAAAEKSDDAAATKRLKIFTTDDVSGIKMTAGKTSGSLTSTVMDVSYDDDAREATEDEILQAQFQAMRKLKKKGYVTLHTNMGDLGLEIHCDIAPRTCTNFLGLVDMGKYDGSVFHRLIPNFMIQGGKPPSKKSKEPDESLWGEPFADEFDDRLVHVGAGILSMANAGPGTNRRQFFITFKSCQHLDRKHSVFGKVVQGLDILQKMEQIPTDKKDRPTTEIKIIRAQVLVNPVKEAQEAEQIRIQERADAKWKEQEARKASALGGKKTKLQQQESGKPASNNNGDGSAASAMIGKYLPKGALNSAEKAAPKIDAAQESAGPSGSKPPTGIVSRLPPPPKKTTFGDFSGW